MGKLVKRHANVGRRQPRLAERRIGPVSVPKALNGVAEYAPADHLVYAESCKRDGRHRHRVCPAPFPAGLPMAALGTRATWADLEKTPFARKGGDRVPLAA